MAAVPAVDQVAAPGPAVSKEQEWLPESLLPGDRPMHCEPRRRMLADVIDASTGTGRCGRGRDQASR